MTVSPPAPLQDPPPRPERPLSREILPLTPGLEALLERSDEEGRRLFREGRARQINGFLRATRGA